MRKSIILAVFMIYLLFPLLMCGTTEDNSTLKNRNPDVCRPIEREGDSVLIAWAPPVNKADSVDHYELHYHPGKNSTWTMLKSNIPISSTPQVTVGRKEVDATDSIFYFAVRSVLKNGTKTDFRYSTDSINIPTGWYIRWK